MRSIIEEILAGNGILLAKAVRRLGVCLETGRRWCEKGLRLRDGRVIRLESAWCGGRLFTSERAIRQFIEAQADDPGPDAAVAQKAARAVPAGVTHAA